MYKMIILLKKHQAST